jgi:transposase
METRETIHLDNRAQHRLQILSHVLAGELTADEAAGALGLSTRQVKRLVRRYHDEGAAALIHGNLGRMPVNRTDPAIRARLVELATTEFAGFNPVHLAETLAEEGHTELAVSPRTIRRILAEAGHGLPRTRRSPRHRSRRERMPRAGMLLQVDGSRHDWLEGRGPMLTLIAGIDDATGIVTAATFRTAEDAAGYLEVFRRTVVRHGRPLAVYSDHHGIFVKDPGRPATLTEQLAGKRSLTQVGRALDEAGIGWIGASSPQAKGRVERLWGTKQDRLASELRRAGAATIEEANVVLARYLARHNRRFAIAPADPEPAWRGWPAELEMDAVFGFCYPRRVARDATLSWEGRALALPARADGRSWAGTGVVVEERLDGSLWVSHAGTAYHLTDAPPEPVTLRARHLRREPLADLAAASAAHELVPTMRSGARSAPGNHDPNHPWRRYAAVRPR